MKTIHQLLLRLVAAIIMLAVSVHAENLPTTNHLVLWLKADDLKLKHQQKVEKWNDLSPSHNPATNSLAASQPTFITNAIHDKSAVRFDGQNNFLKLTHVPLPVGFSYAVVIRTKSKASEVSYPGNASVTIIGDNSGGTWCLFGIREGRPQYNYYKGGGDSEDADWLHLTGQKSIADGEARVMILTHGADGLIDLYVNGHLEITDHAAYVADFIGFERIASGYSGEEDKGANVFDGDIAKVLVYNKVLLDTDRWSLQKYLGGKYQIAISKE